MLLPPDSKCVGIWIRIGFGFITCSSMRLNQFGIMEPVVILSKRKAETEKTMT